MSGSTIAIILLSLSVLGLLAVILRVFSKLLQFDEMLQLLVHDIETNLKYFAKLLSTPTYSNSQEVTTANHNMLIIAKRLSEYVTKMEELSNRKLRTKEQSHKPPVVR